MRRSALQGRVARIAQARRAKRKLTCRPLLRGHDGHIAVSDDAPTRCGAHAIPAQEHGYSQHGSAGGRRSGRSAGAAGSASGDLHEGDTGEAERQQSGSAPMRVDV